MNNRYGSKRETMLERLADIPGKLISLHGRDNLAEFVLHSVCNPSCLNLKKAAYFVDNPDFNHLHGLAGYCEDEAFAAQHPELCWQASQKFSDHMNSASFNQAVRNVRAESFSCKNGDYEALIKKLAQQLHIEHPEYYHWGLKNDNHGIVIFEHDKTRDHHWTQDDLNRAVHLLGFCPIF